MKYKILVLALLIFSSATIGQVVYDESKVPEYQLPEVLKLSNGETVRSPEEWSKKRRPEILTLFEDHVYGKVPPDEIEVTYEIFSEDVGALNGLATRREVEIRLKNEMGQCSFDLLLYLPNSVENYVPVFLGMNFYGNHTIHEDEDIRLTSSWIRNNPDFHVTDNKATEESRGVRAHRWPVETILKRGYGIATIYYGDLDPDFHDEFKNGLHSILEYRDQNDRSSISAWAAGLSAAMDYFETDSSVDHQKVTVIGHSRLGKTALWAGARDRRFAMVISNNSGCGGAALSRRKFGETIKAINEGFPHWFSTNFHQYNDREEDLPVDQHMLIGLIAPRPVYIASAEEDQWADPRGEYLSLYHASPVYELFGYESIDNIFPEVDKPKWVGQIGYHIRSGKHDITYYDWNQYLDFADLHLNLRDQ